MAENLRDLFRMKLSKMREDSNVRGTALPFLGDLLAPSPELAIPSAGSSRERPSTSRHRKESAPEVLEMRRQFKVVREQLGPVVLAQKGRAEKKERRRQEKREEAKRKEAEAKGKEAEAKRKEVDAKAKSVSKGLPSTSTKASGTSAGSASRTSEKRPDTWHKQTQAPQQHKTTAADLASKDRTMTYTEKCQLTQDLCQLPEKQLGGMVRILHSREPKLKVKNNKMEVNVDALKSATLSELKDYVKACRQKKDKAAAGKACGAAAGTSQGQRAATSSSRSQSEPHTQSEYESEWETPSSSDSDP